MTVLFSGIAVAGSGIGTFIMAPLTEHLIDTYSWRGAMAVIGAIMLNLVVCGALFRPLVSFELRKKRQKYLRSLERFSRASSRRQSKEGIERRSNYGDADVLGVDRSDEVALHHSLILLPTYLNSYSSPLNGLSGLYITESKQISKSNSDTTLVHDTKRTGQSNFPAHDPIKFELENMKANKPVDDCVGNLGTSQLKKSILVNGKRRRTKSHNTNEEKKKKIRFPEHLVPRRNTDIFYRGSLLKAGFLLNRGQSASCPDIFVHAHKHSSLHKRFQSIQLRSIMHKIQDVTDFSIFKNKMFLLFCVHSMLLNVSYDIPYVYIPSIAENFSIPDNMASFLLSIIGIVSTVGQASLDGFALDF